MVTWLRHCWPVLRRHVLRRHRRPLHAVGHGLRRLIRSPALHHAAVWACAWVAAPALPAAAPFLAAPPPIVAPGPAPFATAGWPGAGIWWPSAVESGVGYAFAAPPQPGLIAPGVLAASVGPAGAQQIPAYSSPAAPAPVSEPSGALVLGLAAAATLWLRRGVR